MCLYLHLVFLFLLFHHSLTYLFIKLYIFVYIGFDIYVLKLDLIVNDALSSETWLSGSCETCLNVKQGSQSAVIVLICVCAVLLLLLPFASFIDLFLVCPFAYLFTAFFSFFLLFIIFYLFSYSTIKKVITNPLKHKNKKHKKLSHAQTWQSWT